MKQAFIHISIFALFTLVFSTLAGCSGPATSNNAVAGSETNTQGAKEKTPAPNSRPLSTEITEAELKEIKGANFKLSDKKGKVVLLNLWATWCGPCRGEMPTLVKLQDQFKDQGFEVIGLNTDDESTDKIGPFAEEMKLNYTIVWSTGAFQNELLKISKFPGIPQSFLIDRDGNLRAVFTGGGPDTIRKLDESVTRLVQEQS